MSLQRTEVSASYLFLFLSELLRAIDDAAIKRERKKMDSVIDKSPLAYFSLIIMYSIDCLRVAKDYGPLSFFNPLHLSNFL